MQKKIIGILGGMGPEATIDLFQKIVKSTPAKEDQEHLRIIIDNNPNIPDRSKAILDSGENPLPELIRTARNLEKAGADFIIMPCNTAHYYYSDIQKAIKIPLIHMIQETANSIHDKFSSIYAVSLLATKGTYQTKLYQNFLEKMNIETIIPDPAHQTKIMEIIYGIKASQSLADLKKQIIEIAQDQIILGAQGIIAGCTEIPLVLKNGYVSIPVIDPTLVLAQKAVEAALKKP